MKYKNPHNMLLQLFKIDLKYICIDNCFINILSIEEIGYLHKT